MQAQRRTCRSVSLGQLVFLVILLPVIIIGAYIMMIVITGSMMTIGLRQHALPTRRSDTVISRMDLGDRPPYSNPTIAVAEASKADRQL